MSLFDKVKNMMSVSDEDEFDDDEVVESAPKNRYNFEEEYTEKRKQPEKTSQFPVEKKVLKGGNSSMAGMGFNSQLQVALVKPERFEDAPPIADHLNDQRAVVLNLEAAPREVQRRLLDFLSGVAYANGCKIKKVANSTFIITPNNVDVMGELILDEYETNNMYL